MAQREKVTDEVGRQWVTGSLDSDTYFAEVRRRARRQAEQMLAARLDGDPADARRGTDASGRDRAVGPPVEHPVEHSVESPSADRSGS